MDEVTGGGETAQGVGEAQQTGVTEAGGSQTQGGGAAPQTPQEWRVGDTTFKTPAELHQAALRWQGDFTRVSQRLSGMEKEMGGFKAVFNVVTQDPRLRQEVMARMQGGQSQQQAVQQTAQAHPELLKNFQSLKQEVDQLKQSRVIDEQDRAQYEFKEKHPDIKEAEWTAMAQFIGQNHEWFGPSMTPSQMIEVAFNSTVLPQRMQAQAAAQQQAAADTQNGRQKPLLGSQAASAGARAQSLERPKGRLSPQQEREHAQKVFERSKNQR